jgi:hypothetical protein
LWLLIPRVTTRDHVTLLLLLLLLLLQHVLLLRGKLLELHLLLPLVGATTTACTTTLWHRLLLWLLWLLRLTGGSAARALRWLDSCGRTEGLHQRHVCVGLVEADQWTVGLFVG